ncbi:MAG: hypothetical protein H6867_00310 [Rhodospirillales bacterium]|nr:hypothetical protein [Rhodospirillales bacterium]MCB9996899.1 hypothetical protein [Rhodospirillales bacterium]
MRIFKVKWLVILGCCLFLAGCKSPGKVTDPSDPNFDPMQFRFEDYRSREEFQPVLRQMFPVGTPKEHIDKILIDAGGAKDKGVTLYSRGFYRYEYKPWYFPITEMLAFSNCMPWSVRVCYDEQQKSFIVQGWTPCVSNTFKTDNEEVCNDNRR